MAKDHVWSRLAGGLEERREFAGVDTGIDDLRFLGPLGTGS
jgi:hypothetical protein